MSRLGHLETVAIALLTCTALAASAACAQDAADTASHDAPVGREVVNVRDFADQVVDGDWSPAIQAAIDHVDAANGFTRGAVIYFPAGDYRIDQTLVLGRNAAHWGVQLLGYGARLIGSTTLDAVPQEPIWNRKAEELQGERRKAHDDDKGLGAAILELRNPPDFEGSGFVIEGLTFDREAVRQGVGIRVAADEVPKATTFRSIRVFRQDVGVHVNYAWQFHFSDCIFRSNTVGVRGLNHFNAVSFVNCTFRRNHHHGLQLGPNLGQWGSSSIHIAGCIFEANKGYGIYNAGGVQTTISGCYFEANGNSIAIESSFGNTTVDTCHFWSTYPAQWNITPYQGQGHIIINGTRNVQLRNNRYGKGQPIFLVGSLGGNLNRFDADPLVASSVSLPDAMRVACDDGLTYYEFDAAAGQFVRKAFAAGHVIRDDDLEQDGD